MEGGIGVGGKLNSSFKKKIISRVISLGLVEAPSPETVINLPRENNKLHCKGEPYQISG